jgi:YidC/Oxa1 family membrane protein insertase
MMDRRMLLALALSALVVVATQLLFPSKRPAAPVAGTQPPDSAQVSRPPGDTTAAASTAASTAAPTRAHVATAPAITQAGIPGAPAVPAETLLVSTPHAVYRFTNIGAAPITVALRDYPARAPGTSGAVTLAHDHAPLLRYVVVSGPDTLALDRTVFQGTVTYLADSTPLVTFTAAVGGTPVTIRYALSRIGYLSRVQGTIGGSALHGTAPAFLLVGLPGGLNSNESDTLDDQRHLAYSVKPAHEDASSTAFAKLDPGEEKLIPGPITWAVAKDKYFLLGILTPATGIPTFAEVHLVGGARTSKVVTQGQATVVQALAGRTNGGGGGADSATFAFDLYAGPQAWRSLRSVGGNRDFDDVNPYGGFLHPVLKPFAAAILQTIIWMRDNLKLSYGWVLIIFGVLIRFLLWPLNQRAMRSSLKMQVLQPELQAVQTRYKNDPQRLQAELMKVYREHDMSPFSAMSGCLPMLLPMPVFFTLLFVFQNTIEFRGVPFLWLHDISVKDPYYILPLLMGASAFLLSWIGLRNTPPNPQSRMMAYMFPGMMMIFLANVAAGLNLYYAVQNLAAIPQQWLIARERQKQGKPNPPSKPVLERSSGRSGSPSAPATPSPRRKRKGG